MQTLKINIPKGFRVKAFDEKTGEVSFEAIINIRERISTIHDVFELNGTTEEEFNEKFPDAGVNARELELLIVAAYNEGKKPDFADGKSKYLPVFEMPNKSGALFRYCDYVDWFTFSSVSARQLFVGDEAKANMLDATTKFLPQYEKSRIL